MAGPRLEEMMLRPGIRRAFGGVVLAGLAAACSQNGSPASPSALSSAGVLLEPSAGTTATRAPANVPFKGRLEGAFTLVFPDPVTLLVTGEGTGNATQLGQFTFKYDERVDLSTGTGVGTYEFTAANGDTLTADWTGVGFPTEDPTVIAIVEHATITGGTGRFANAGGTFTIQRLFSFVTNSGGGSFEGTIQRK